MTPPSSPSSPVTLDDLLALPPFSLGAAAKKDLLLPLLRETQAHHVAACPVYAKITAAAFPRAATAQTYEDLAYLPITLFKHRRLHSVPNADLRVSVRSSGTTGTVKSQIDMDAADARLTARALATIFRDITQGARLPLLIVDTPSVLRKTDTSESDEALGARAAAILGLMPFGRDACFILHDDFSVDEPALTAFLARHGSQPFLIYGFTSLIWQYFAPLCEAIKPDLRHATLLHSGGWKKLQDQAVSRKDFQTRLQKAAAVGRVRNFYGMAEMPGTVFLENENGLLAPPNFATILIRDPVSFAPLPLGAIGLVQILHPLPRSFPGHSLLTEDLGVLRDTGHDSPPALEILGRVPKAVMRGCSDVGLGFPPSSQQS